MPPTTFGMDLVENDAFPGSSRSGENASRKSRGHESPDALQHGQQFFVSGAGIRGRLQDHQLALPQSLRDLRAGVVDVGHVRLAVAAERRRDADQDRVAVAKAIEVRRCRESPARHRALHPVRADVLDVGPALVQGLDLLRIDIEARYREPGLLKDDRQRQAHVPLADDRDPRFPPLDPLEPVHAGLSHFSSRW